MPEMILIPEDQDGQKCKLIEYIANIHYEA